MAHTFRLDGIYIIKIKKTGTINYLEEKQQEHKDGQFI